MAQHSLEATTQKEAPNRPELASADCLSGCDKIKQEETEKLKAIHRQQRTTLLESYRQQETALLSQEQELQQAQKQAYRQLLDPDSEQRAECQALYDQVLQSQKSISQAIEKLSLPETDYDKQRQAIETLKDQSKGIEAEWRRCRDKRIAETPKYGERQRRFIESSKQWAIASTRISELKDERRWSLDAQQRSQDQDFEWLDKVYAQCKDTGRWSARIAENPPQECACEIKAALDALLDSMQQRQRAEKDFYASSKALDHAWQALNAVLKEKADEMTPAVSDWVSDGVSLALDANLTLFDIAAARNVAKTRVTAGPGEILNIVGNKDWLDIREAGRRLAKAYYSADKSLITASGKAAKLITPLVTKFGQASAKNKGFMVSSYKNLSGLPGNAPARIQGDLLDISDLQLIIANRLQALVELQDEEGRAWQALMSSPCMAAACGKRLTGIDELRDLSESLYSATDQAARQEFVQRAFSEAGPYNQALLATGRFCDLCAGLSHLLKLQAFSSYSRSVVGRIEVQITEYQQAYTHAINNLSRYLDGNKGVMEKALGDYHIYYTLATTAASFWFPWPMLAVSVTEAAVNNWDNATNKVPFATETEQKLRSLATQLDDKRVDIIYWRNYASSLDKQLGYLIERINKCAARECENPTEPIDIPRDEGAQCEVPNAQFTAQGCWRIEQPGFVGDVLFGKRGERMTAQVSHGLIEPAPESHANQAAIDPNKVLEFDGVMNSDGLHLEHTYSREKLREVVSDTYPDHLVDKMIELGAKATIRGTVRKDVDYYEAGFQKWDVLEGRYIVLNFAVENYDYGRDQCPEPGIKIDNFGDGEVVYTLAYNDEAYCLYRTGNRNDVYLISDDYYPVSDQGELTWLKLDPIAGKVTAMNVRNTPFDNAAMMDGNPIHIGDRIWLEAYGQQDNCRFRQDSLTVRLTPQKSPAKAFTATLKETSESSGLYRSDINGIGLEFAEKDVLENGDYGNVQIIIDGAPLYNNLPAHGFVNIQKK